MDLRRLRYFVAVAERLNFTAAAKFLGIAQPPLSVQIRNLEKEVGGALFLREGRKVRLTPLGAHFLEEARSLLHEADRMTERVRDAAEGRIGELRVACTQGALSEKVTKKIRKFLRKSRGVRLAATWHSPSDGRRRRPVDATITESLELPAEGVLLERARLQIAMPPKHRLADRTEIAFADLLGEPLFISPVPFRSPSEQWMAAQYESRGLRVDASCNSAFYWNPFWSVSVGIGLSLCTSADRCTLDAVRVDLAEAPEILTVCIPDPDSKAVALAAFLESIRE